MTCADTWMQYGIDGCGPFRKMKQLQSQHAAIGATDAWPPFSRPRIGIGTELTVQAQADRLNA